MLWALHLSLTCYFYYNSPLSVSLFGAIMVVLGGAYIVTSRGTEKPNSKS